MTATVNVERIDIIEGPNLEGLLKPWLMKSAIKEAGETLPEGISDIHLRFDKVRYMQDNRIVYEELGTTFFPLLVAICLLGGVTTNRKRDNFVITVWCVLGTFEGHYSTRTRKGSLAKK